MTGLWLVAAPLAASALGLMVGRNRRAVAVVSVVGTALALAFSMGLWLDAPWEQVVVGDGIGGRFQPLPFITVVDGLSVTVAVMVSFVALLVQVYSVAYMRRELRYATYASFVSLFTAAMLAVVVAGDLLFLVVGWEVMGLCSYLLIGQHWEQPEAQRAAVKAFLVTKFGDVGFIIGIVVLIGATDTLVLSDAVTAATRETGLATVVSLLLFVGVMGKSAQFPLHAWLPDAMAGPSPVSALIHAATMVAAGVFVVARMFPMFLAAPTTLTVMAVVACITMTGAALAAFAQDDLKRVLAWSTVSQLAYMVAALAVGSSEAAVFQLLTHAFFKALLFLGAGAVIYCAGSSSLSELGGLRRAMPITFATMSLALLALVGVVPLSGFFSKESVLVAAEDAASGGAEVSSAVGWLVLVAATTTIAITAAYAARLWYMTFLGRGKQSKAQEPSRLMTLPLIVLAIPTVAFGIVGLSADWLPTWMTPNATETDWVPAVLTPEPLTIALSSAAVVLGVLLAAAATRRSPSGDAAAMLGALRPRFANGFGVDVAYRWLAVKPYRLAVRATVRVDETVIAPSVGGVGRSAVLVGDTKQRVQRGDVQRYLSATLTALIVAIVLVLIVVAK